MKRTAGVLIPLFSIRTERGWGVGEFPDVATLAPTLKEARLSLLMTLPLLEASLGQDSPYSALSAFALDPIFLSLEQLEDFRALGGESALPDEERLALSAARERKTVDYGTVRAIKERALRRCFEHFKASGAAAGSERAHDLARFREEESSWLPEYSLFRALKESRRHLGWRSWETPLRERHPSALDSARAEHADACAYFEYLQWNAFRQLETARQGARQQGIRLAGDLPFMVAEDSADVWARQDEFGFDATIGAPPDAFSADGQDWGLPIYRWDVIADRGFEWLRERGERTAELFDLVRVDHVVGFYRTYVRPLDKKKPFFVPDDEPSQILQGEAVLTALRHGGAEVIAEDLGVIPPFVRKSLARLGIPGYRVLPWEQEGGKFRDPAKWPALSLATTGTHDSEPIAVWWDALSATERKAACELPSLKDLSPSESSTFGPRVHQALLEAVYGARSALLALPIQDIFGTNERINLPGTVSADNWSYRLPWTLERLHSDPVVTERIETLAALARRFNREDGEVEREPDEVRESGSAS